MEWGSARKKEKMCEQQRQPVCDTFNLNASVFLEEEKYEGDDEITWKCRRMTEKSIEFCYFNGVLDKQKPPNEIRSHTDMALCFHMFRIRFSCYRCTFFFSWFCHRAVFGFVFSTSFQVDKCHVYCVCKYE